MAQPPLRGNSTGTMEIEGLPAIPLKFEVVHVRGEKAHLRFTLDPDTRQLYEAAFERFVKQDGRQMPDYKPQMAAAS